MIYIWLNAGAIAAATLAGLLVGRAWLAFARRPAPLALLPVTALAEAWLAAILAGALILAPDQAPRWIMAVGSAVVIWIGFVVPALVVTGRARVLGWGAIGGDCLHWLAAMVAQAVVLEAIGLTAPPS